MNKDLTKYTNKGLNDLLFKSIKEENYELSSLINKELKSRSNDYTMGVDDQIKTIVNNFDFDKVESVMLALDWEWLSSGTPNVEQIQASATRLLKDAWNYEEGHETITIASGGLSAQRVIFDGVKMLSLAFVVTDWIMDWDSVHISYDKYHGI